MQMMARIYAKEEIHSFLMMKFNSPTWILGKCAVALSFCGVLRSIELHSILFGTVSQLLRESG